MKSLIRNYIDLLSVDKLNEFALKNNINLTNDELNYILNLVKTNWEDILINENKYLNDLKNHLNEDKYIRIKDLFIYYKDRYKGYLF